MRRKWNLLAPLAFTALCALAAGIVTLLQKLDEQEAAPAEKKTGPVRDPAKQKLGSYSFISGFQNAATVELTIPYDAEKESFSVVEEGFLSPSDDSHVALLYSEDYSLQLEYATYYGGEGWQAHCAALRDKHSDLKELSFGDNQGVLFLDGDSLRLDLVIPGDTASFVQVTIQESSAFDGEVTELAVHPALTEQLAGITFTRS